MRGLFQTKHINDCMCIKDFSRLRHYTITLEINDNFSYHMCCLIINIILDFFLLYLMIGDTCTRPLPSSVYRKEFLEKLYTGDHL